MAPMVDDANSGSHCRTLDYISRSDGGTAAHQRCYHSSVSRRGKFITFEGLDGTGKSTQQHKLGAALRLAGYKVVETREPGGTETGEKIRGILLDSKTDSLSAMAEMALMFASRAQHIAEVIQPALDRGQIVLCDRFTDSTEAYQGNGRRLGSENVLKLHRILCGNLQPDLTILLDSDPAMSLGRARRRNRLAANPVSNGSNKSAGKSHADENRFEQQSRSFFARVQEGYRAIAAREPERVVVVDASGTPTETHHRILEIVNAKLRLGTGSAPTKMSR
jgi:dTMP kinase